MSIDASIIGDDIKKFNLIFVKAQYARNQMDVECEQKTGTVLIIPLIDFLKTIDPSVQISIKPGSMFVFRFRLEAFTEYHDRSRGFDPPVQSNPNQGGKTRTVQQQKNSGWNPGSKIFNILLIFLGITFMAIWNRIPDFIHWLDVMVRDDSNH